MIISFRIIQLLRIQVDTLINILLQCLNFQVKILHFCNVLIGKLLILSLYYN